MSRSFVANIYRTRLPIDGKRPEVLATATYVRNTIDTLYGSVPVGEMTATVTFVDGNGTVRTLGLDTFLALYEIVEQPDPQEAQQAE